MESLNGREIPTTDASHAQAHNQHLYASAFGSPQNRGRAADNHSVEPHQIQPQSTHPVEPPKNPAQPPKNPVEPPSHPVEPPSHPVEPPKNPVEPPSHPVEPPGNPSTHRLMSPPAETFHPDKPEKRDAAKPKPESHTPSGEHPVPEKPQTPDRTPPDKTHTSTPSDKGTPAVPSEHPTPLRSGHPGQGGELHIVYDHTYKSDEEHRTIQQRIEHARSQTDQKKHAASAEHEKSEHHQTGHSTHHSDNSRHSSHHSERSHHSSHHRDSSSRHSHHEGHHGSHHTDRQPGGHHSKSHHSVHQAESHHDTSRHADSQHSVSRHTDNSAKITHDTHQSDKSHVVDKSKHAENHTTVDVKTVHVDKKHVEEHTHFDFSIKFPEIPGFDSKPAVEPPKEVPPALQKGSEPTERVKEPIKPTPVEAPPVASPPAEPTRVEKPTTHSLKPADTSEITTSISPGQVAVTLTHEHHVDPKTYLRASVNAGVAGDHVGLGNTNLMIGRHLFSPYDKNGNPTRGNLNVEGGLVLQTGHTYEFGKLPRFGDTSAVVGLNGYYQPTRDLTLYGAAQHATNPRQYDLQLGAIKDSGRFSFQLGGEVSNVEGYGTSHFLTPGVSYRLNKNTSVYVSGAVDLDGHKERSAAFTGFRFKF
ncbi:MAG TPA: hypothetical protein V6C89_08080 [Drouetiella sp.]